MAEHLKNKNQYHELLKKGLANELEIAKRARSKGLDPALQPEIKVTSDLAERVEALIGIKGVGARIRELEHEGYGTESACAVPPALLIGPE